MIAAASTSARAYVDDFAALKTALGDAEGEYPELKNYAKYLSDPLFFTQNLNFHTVGHLSSLYYPANLSNFSNFVSQETIQFPDQS